MQPWPLHTMSGAASRALRAERAKPSAKRLPLNEQKPPVPFQRLGGWKLSPENSTRLPSTAVSKAQCQRVCPGKGRRAKR